LKKIYGLVKPALDAHTLGINAIKGFLSECGETVVVANRDVSIAANDLHSLKNQDVFMEWIGTNRITHLGISYRLDPDDAQKIMHRIIDTLHTKRLFVREGGTIVNVYFAGLPESCRRIKKDHGQDVVTFIGSEGFMETLLRMDVPKDQIPLNLQVGSRYDAFLMDIAREYIESKKYEEVEPSIKGDYPGFGNRQDRLVDRLADHRKRSDLPLTRAHVGPYKQHREEAVAEFEEWCRRLAKTGYLDICSIGSSQLTQSRFNEDWSGLPNGGGVPIQTPNEYERIYEACRPMLVRTYSGTKNVDRLAVVHEETLNIAWHALSLWWFNQLDGRGENDLLTNLKQHCETLRYIASTKKPFEPNTPHHFAFRGSDDVTYIVSAVLAARTAKYYGINDFILQVMLNTPRSTWGIVDLAKARAILQLIRPLSDDSFHIYLQPRAGLDYFAPDETLAKIQLASVSMLMDDIEPDDNSSPNIVHVVSYSEALYLATPPVIDESIKITLGAIRHYRTLKNAKKADQGRFEEEIVARTKNFVDEANIVLEGIEKSIDEPYTPEGLYAIFASGFLPTPYLWGNVEAFPNATAFGSRVLDGSTVLCDDKGRTVDAQVRVAFAMKNVGSLAIKP